MKPVFVITTYQQVELVLCSIRRIGEEYPAPLKTSPIIVVSTAEERVLELHLHNWSVCTSSRSALRRDHRALPSSLDQSPVAAIPRGVRSFGLREFSYPSRKG
jgi:hypothetical protein